MKNYSEKFFLTYKNFIQQLLESTEICKKAQKKENLKKKYNKL